MAPSVTLVHKNLQPPSLHAVVSVAGYPAVFVTVDRVCVYVFTLYVPHAASLGSSALVLHNSSIKQHMLQDSFSEQFHSAVNALRTQTSIVVFNCHANCMCCIYTN